MGYLSTSYLEISNLSEIPLESAGRRSPALLPGQLTPANDRGHPLPQVPEQILNPGCLGVVFPKGDGTPEPQNYSGRGFEFHLLPTSCHDV